MISISENQSILVEFKVFSTQNLVLRGFVNGHLDFYQLILSVEQKFIAEQEKVSVVIDICNSKQHRSNEKINSSTHEVEWDTHLFAVLEESVESVSQTEIGFIHNLLAFFFRRTLLHDSSLRLEDILRYYIHFCIYSILSK